MSKTGSKKATIYLDQDDEITNVISQINDTPEKIIALVLPKRAPTFQSVVNLKLLQKAADKQKKKVVLITNDKTITSLAGTASMYIATTPQTRPFIPDAPEASHQDTGETEVIDTSKSIGDLEEAHKNADEDTIADADLPKKLTLDENANKRKNKTPKIPNFNKFRTRIFIGSAVLILLIVGWIYAIRVLPRADILIETASQSSAQTIEFQAVRDQKEVNTSDFSVPLFTETFTGTEVAQATTTGERNVGERASGSVELKNCINQSDGFTLPAGTIIGSGNFRFTTTEDIELPPTLALGSVCITEPVTVSVQATEPGQQNNISARSYSVEGFPEVQAEGSDMSGGTDELVRVVNERDITSARDVAERELTPTARTELEEIHRFEGRQPLIDTFESVDSTAQASPNEGSEADQVSVSLEAEFSMFGIRTEDIVTLLQEDMSDEVNFDNQSIIDDGLANASIRIVEQNENAITISIRTIVSVGTEIDEAELVNSLTGTKRSEAENLILSIDGVRDVQIDYSPFWVASTPTRVDNIRLTIIQQGLQEQDPVDEPSDEESASE